MSLSTASVDWLVASLKTATHPWWAPLPVTPRRSPPSGKGACLLGQPAACQPEEHCFLWACRASPWAREVAPGHPPRLLGALAATVPAAAALRRPGRLPLSRPGEAASASLPLRVACRCHSAFSVRPLEPVPGRFEVECRSLGWTSTVRTQPRVHGLSPPVYVWVRSASWISGFIVLVKFGRFVSVISPTTCLPSGAGNSHQAAGSCPQLLMGYSFLNSCLFRSNSLLSWC